MSDSKYLEEKVFDLQARLAFQEDTLQQLNSVIARQDATIAELQEQMRGLVVKVKDLAFELEQQAPGSYHERPPHY